MNVVTYPYRDAYQSKVHNTAKANIIATSLLYNAPTGNKILMLTTIWCARHRFVSALAGAQPHPSNTSLRIGWKLSVLFGILYSFAFRRREISK